MQRRDAGGEPRRIPREGEGRGDEPNILRGADKFQAAPGYRPPPGARRTSIPLGPQGDAPPRGSAGAPPAPFPGAARGEAGRGPSSMASAHVHGSADPQGRPGGAPAGAPAGPAPAPLPASAPGEEAAEAVQPADPREALGKTMFTRLEHLATSSPSPRHLLEAWLEAMVKCGASDLILRASGRVSTRMDGRIGFLPGRVPGPGAMLEVLEGVLGEERMELWRQTGSADAALHLDGLGRFRLNAYKQMGEPALVVRRIADQTPVLEELELPTAELSKIAMRKRGLVLVTGVAGSGKSTTLAAMIQHMNMNLERHVITLEDPVELLFREKRCVISQREVGTDCMDFQDGLRHALRQSPDVILIGEMRDGETVNAALDAAETGHLVLSTMHTVNAAQTLDRILGFFPGERHRQLRMRLAENLAAVLSQRLIPRASGRGMVPAFELMTTTPRIRELLDEGQAAEIARVIEAGGTPGLISFNQSLRRLVQTRLVDLKDALSASDRPDELVLALRGITDGRREAAARPGGPSGSGGAPGGPQGGGPPQGNGGGGLRVTGE